MQTQPPHNVLVHIKANLKDYDSISDSSELFKEKTLQSLLKILLPNWQIIISVTNKIFGVKGVHALFFIFYRIYFRIVEALNTDVTTGPFSINPFLNNSNSNNSKLNHRTSLNEIKKSTDIANSSHINYQLKQQTFFLKTRVINFHL